MAVDGGACTELENTLYFYWRVSATICLIFLTFLIHRIWRKNSKTPPIEFNCSKCQQTRSDGKRKNGRYDSADGTVEIINQRSDSLQNNFRQRRGHYAEQPTTYGKSDPKSSGDDEGSVSTAILPKSDPRGVVRLEKASHVTSIESPAQPSNGGAKMLRIVTTVEVQIQPHQTVINHPVNININSISIKEEDDGDQVDSAGGAEIGLEHSSVDGDQKTNSDQGEKTIDQESVAINSMLEVANAHSIEEMVEKVETLDAVADIIREAGLESSNLIFGIDYTASNKFQGETTFHGKSLHSIEKNALNPYQQVISVLGKTLAPFANSGFIAGYGFGDAKTEDSGVFPLKTETGFCISFNQMLDVYNEITPTVILSGPTNFAPLIYEAIKICKQVKTYHILVIVADGQVTNEQATVEAIVEACKYPLSIIVVGVGDGPWQMMKAFDHSLPKRTWDNFHFVEFHKVTASAHNPDSAFAVQTLVEIPDQYKKIKALGLLKQ